MLFELLTGGDYLFDPASGHRYSKDDDHIAQILELLGDFPKKAAFAGKYSHEFFNRQGELRHIAKLRYWPLRSVLREKYILPPDQADLISSFLLPMLRLEPDRRAKAGELIHHAWLEGIVVKGELEVLRAAEDDDRREREEREREKERGVQTGSSERGGEKGKERGKDRERNKENVRSSPSGSGAGAGSSRGHGHGHTSSQSHNPPPGRPGAAANTGTNTNTGESLKGLSYGEMDAMKPADDPRDALAKEEEERDRARENRTLIEKALELDREREIQREKEREKLKAQQAQGGSSGHGHGHGQGQGQGQSWKKGGKKKGKK